MSLTEGENVGPYQIIEKLGQGGMATVYKAYHAGLDRYVALKVLHPDLTGDPTFIARFQREARVIEELDHPNIVPVHDFSEHDGYPYLVMKFIEGETLKARLERGSLTSSEINKIVDAVGSALTYAHQQGILHRDIKPSNVLMAKDGHIFLADFGLARIAQATTSTLTNDAILGTPQYISPEQAMGKSDLDERTDIYSFGVMLYEMTVGRVPFSADTPFSIIYDHIYSPLPLPRTLNPSVPESVERVLLKALAKEQGDRYKTVSEMVAAFKSVSETASPDTASVPRESPVQVGQSSVQKTVTNKTVVTSKARHQTWIFVAGGIVAALCCMSVGIFSLPGILKQFNNPTPTPTLIEPTATQFSNCTGEQSWFTRDYFPEQEIQHCWDQNHYISSVAYSNGEWTIVMTKTANYSDQTYLVDSEFPQTKVREYWDQGYDITGGTYANGEWAIVMSAGTGFTNQTYFSGSNFPNEDIQSYWNQGYSITWIGYGDGTWFVVMSKGAAQGKQVYFVEADLPVDRIKSYWDSNYYITGVTYGNAVWVIVMSQMESYSNQYYYHDESFPADGIREDWGNDFFITDLSYGDSLWIVVMSKQ